MKAVFNFGRKLFAQSPSGNMRIEDPSLVRGMLKPLNGEVQRRFKNPGIHTQANFVSEEEEKELLVETKALKSKFAFVAGEYMELFKTNVDSKQDINSLKGDKVVMVPWRVTGRCHRTMKIITPFQMNTNSYLSIYVLCLYLSDALYFEDKRIEILPLGIMGINLTSNAFLQF